MNDENSGTLADAQAARSETRHLPPEVREVREEYFASAAFRQGHRRKPPLTGADVAHLRKAKEKRARKATRRRDQTV